MAASLTNGYDLVIELSPNRLREIMLRQILGPTTSTLGSSITLPIEGPLPLSGIPVNFIINTLPEITIQENSRIIIRITFTTLSTIFPQFIFNNVALELSFNLNFVNNENITLSVQNLVINRLDLNPTEVEDFLNLIRTTIPVDSLRALNIDPNIFANSTNFNAFIRAQIAATLSTDLIELGAMQRNLSNAPCMIRLREMRVVTFNNMAFILIALSLNGATPVLRPEAFSPSSSFRRANDSALMVSNATLLDLAICFSTGTPGSPLFNRMATASGNCRVFTMPIPVTLASLQIPEIGFREDLIFNFRSLSICITGNTITIAGSGDLNYRTGTIFVTFSLPVRFIIDANGIITPNIDQSRARINIRNEVEWWVGLGASLGFVPPVPIIAELSMMTVFLQTALFSPMTGSIINLITTLTLPFVANSVNQTINLGLPGLIPPILRNFLGQLRLQQVILDDLEMKGEFTLVALPDISIEESALVSDERVDSVNYAVINKLYAHIITYKYLTRNYGAILRHRWSIDGIELARPSGSLTLLDGQIIHYENNSRPGEAGELIIRTEMGKSLVCIIGVRVWSTTGYARSRFYQTNVIGYGHYRNYDFLTRIRALSNDFIIIRRTPIDPVPFKYNVSNAINPMFLANSMKLDVKEFQEMISKVLNR